MIKYKIGDKVKVVDDNTFGVITEISENSVIIESEHGFDETYKFHEILPDVGMEEEIEETRPKKPKKTISKKIIKAQSKQIIENESKEDLHNREALEQMVHENFAKNREEYRSKLEEKYKKEIKKSKKRTGTFVLDLHYGQLENYSAQLPTQHILKKQLNAAIRGIEKAQNENFQKIILIHGKGKGVLETEIKKYLDINNFTYYDADFRQYKLGSTEVELK